MELHTELNNKNLFLQVEEAGVLCWQAFAFCKPKPTLRRVLLLDKVVHDNGFSKLFFTCDFFLVCTLEQKLLLKSVLGVLKSDLSFQSIPAS